ncbi:hypothetical protein [Delftia acidovorans]|uniref:hypothetical protein n=1 Tax=Delftia acidovorans TaxID=80866 RepID=UPI00192C6E72|nr:hypothetical protein [Delftia acidovorans]
MPPHLTPARFVTCAVMAASALAAGCSSSTDQMRVALATPVAAKALDPADPTDRSQYRYLYAVYCDGRVDRLDLKNQAKTGSFQLSERSGSPAAIAALPRPGVRPGGCLARPVVTQDAQGGSDGLVNIVASSRLDPDADGRKPYQLLTFALPGWTLQQARNLGSFDALPRLARAADGTLAVQPQDKEPAAAMAAQAQAWSAGNVLLIYALPGQRGMGAALALGAEARIVHLAEFRSGGNDIPPDLHLAPGGRFVLASLKRSVPLGEGLRKVEATGELRLYGVDGRQTRALNQASLAGSVLARSRPGSLDPDQPRTDNDWFNVALTPGGLAVFTDRRGNYQFIGLGQPFDSDPVTDDAQDDADGARPGLVYAAR